MAIPQDDNGISRSAGDRRWLPIGGNVQSYLARGELITQPFRTNQYQATVFSTATVDIGNNYNGADGFASGLVATVPLWVPTSGSGRGAYIDLPFYGGAFGIRWQTDINAGTFCVMIDGVVHGPFGGAHGHLTRQGLYPTATFQDGSTCILIDGALPAGRHYARIILNSNPSANNSVRFFGYLVEAQAGYSRPERTGMITGTPGTLTTSLALVPYTGLRIDRIIYTNLTASPVVVSVAQQGTIFWEKTIPANSPDDGPDFGPNGVHPGLLSHKAGTGSAVNFAVISPA